MSDDRGRGNQLAFELCFADSRISGVTFSPGPGGDGGLFSLSVGPLAEDTVAALERAAREQTPVRLMFNDHPLLLGLVSLERKEPHSVRIVGHVLRTRAKT